MVNRRKGEHPSPSSPPLCSFSTQPTAPREEENSKIGSGESTAVPQLLGQRMQIDLWW